MTDSALKILVINDDASVALKLRQALRGGDADTPVETREVSGLDEGLQLLGGGGLDAVLLSQDRNTVNGFDPLHAICRCNGGIPVIVIAPHRERALVYDAFRNGAQDFVAVDSLEKVDLVNSIQVAIAHQQAQVDVIRDLRDDMESQVHERTMELETANAELERTNKEFRQLDKMKSTFINITSHELRTPLSAITGMLRIIEHKIPQEQDSLMNALRVAVNGADRLSVIVEKTIKMSQVGEYAKVTETTQEDPGELLKVVVEDVMPFVKLRNLNVVTDIAPNLPKVPMERLMMREALEHLLMNAIKFTPDGLYICATIRPMDNEDSVIFRISDTGIGVSDEDRPYVFNEFFSSFDVMHHSSGKYGFEKRGIGLGLAFVKRFIELHRGRVGLETIPGTGSMFYFTLPIHPESTTLSNGLE